MEKLSVNVEIVDLSLTIIIPQTKYYGIIRQDHFLGVILLESTDVAKIAIKMALSTRSEEAELKQTFRNMGVKVCAVDFGGNLVTSIEKIIERSLVAAKREGIIKENVHVLEGALIGATREALSQVLQKAMGFNVGGKIVLLAAMST